MQTAAAPFTVIVAEDDSDDRLMIEEAFANCSPCGLQFLEDGEQLLNYLRREEDYADVPEEDEQRVILLDLNMPKMNGLEALQEIKSDPDLKYIPVVVFTTSETEEDIVRSYNLGVSSFITKPVTFDKVISTLHSYWSSVVTVPGRL